MSEQPKLQNNENLAAAEAAVRSFMDELQAGIDDHNADVYNRHFADDVIWGGPFGATLEGYDTLHAVHERLQSQGAGGRSTYEVVQVLAPAPGVVVAHVRRSALDREEGSFSEMALYVLVERNGEWWLAAGQNTPIKPGQSATD